MTGLACRAAEPAHADGARSSLREGWFGRSLEVGIALDRPVPFRVFTLDGPPRLVLDFAGLDWAGFDPRDIRRDGGEAAIRVGRIGPDWSRLVLDLTGPQALVTAEMQPDGPGARLRVTLRRTSPEAFAAASGAPPGVWPSGGLPSPAVQGTGAVLVAIDPGHGGIDPGAIRDGAEEKDLVLAFGLALRDALAGRGFRVMMTRDGDDFVALADRVALARQAGADVFLSLHVNAESTPAVAGAIAFTRADRGSSPGAAARARVENAADGLAGLDPGDPVGAVLAGVARIETDARSGVLADALVDALRPVATVWAEPRQAANFEVLRAPDMPSVLLELGFLSSPADLAALTSPDWRRGTADALAAGLQGWLAQDAALAAKLRR
ncbi:MAG: N-acetylmuramoyl-L-alanine amidase [Amaricoccus sp.]|uniref:N-acetylmuramoyl-L-alanine amidase n=1 Tax=Amaricoccus sp. TaxID=1872485 RepID=UPI0039E61AAA